MKKEKQEYVIFPVKKSLNALADCVGYHWDGDWKKDIEDIVYEYTTNYDTYKEDIVTGICYGMTNFYMPEDEIANILTDKEYKAIYAILVQRVEEEKQIKQKQKEKEKKNNLNEIVEIIKKYNFSLKEVEEKLKEEENNV